MNKVLEISSHKSKGGRRKIEIVLHKIHEEQLETNKNGIHWTEENTRKNIESVSGIPICAEFVDENKEVPLGHGYTSTERIDGKDTPLFENSEVVGTIEHGEIRTLEVNGETIKALVGIGYVYDQRYPQFVSWIKENLALSKVDTSIEIMGLDENDNKIIYEEHEPTNEFRTPQKYDYSGVAVLSVLPADSDAIVLECAQANNKNKEEKFNMTEKEIMDAVQKAIVETNSAKADVDAKIAELNTAINSKNEKIKELNEKMTSDKKDSEEIIADKDAKIKELNERISELESTVAECKKTEQNAALEKAIEGFSDEEKKFAETEINAFKENPVEGNVDSIVAKIYAGIGQASKKAAEDAKIAEQNAAHEHDTTDIFSEMNSDNADDSDINIF